LVSVKTVVAFLSPRNCESFIGDLEERYQKVLSKKGRTSAAIWFWRQILTSLGAFIWVALNRLFALAVVVELYRRIRS